MKVQGQLIVALSALSALSAACHGQGQKMSAGALERLGEHQLDAKTCERARAGTLGSHNSALWFQDEAMREQATSELQNTSWEPDEVLLSHLGGGWGQLIPHDRPDRLIATRTTMWDKESRRITTLAQLVTLDTNTLAIQPLWDAPAPYKTIRLLGSTEGVLVILGLEAQDKYPHIWTLAPGQPQPLGSLELMHDTSPPTGAPKAKRRRWPILSKRHEGVFLVDVDPTGHISSGLVKSMASHMERVSASEIILYFKDNSCALASLDAPETWSALPRSAQACSRYAEQWKRPVINDQLAAERYAAAPSGCQVQHRITLPQLPEHPVDEGSITDGRVSLTQLRPIDDGNHNRLLVRGMTLTASFTITNELGVQTVSAPTFAMALPPDMVKLELVRVDGQAFWEVQFDLWMPYDPSPHCLMGQLLIETSTGIDEPWQRAVIRLYEEFGKCE